MGWPSSPLSVGRSLSRPILISVLVFIVLGCVVTGYGLTQSGAFAKMPFSQLGAQRYFIFSASCAIFIAAYCKVFKFNLLNAFLTAVLAISLVAGATWSLIVVYWFALSSILVGKFFIKLVLWRQQRNLIFELLVGVGLYGALISLLAHFPVNYRGTHALLISLPLVLWWQEARALLIKFYRAISARSGAPITIGGLEFLAYVVLSIHVVIAFVPEIGHDALATHLFVPVHLTLRQQWGFDVSNYVWAVMPMLADWIFSVGYMLGGESATRLINVGFIAVLALLIREIVFWARGNATGANVAALIFLSTPLTFTESSSLYIESVWASFVVAGAFLVCRICGSDRDEDSLKSELVLAGIILGFAVSAKAVTFTILPILLTFLLVRYRQWCKRENVKFILWGLLFFLFLASIPYAIACWKTGNPLFPFYNHYFQSPYFPAVNFVDPRWGKGLSWDMLYEMTFNCSRYIEGGLVGVNGFQWLVLLIPSCIVLLASANRRALGVLCLAGLSLLLTTFFIAYIRYVFPSLVILIAVIGVAASSTETVGAISRKVLSAVLTVVIFLNLVFLNAAAGYFDFPTNTIISETAREDYLAKQSPPIRIAVNLVNQLNLGRAPVAIFGEGKAAGLSADAIYSNWYAFQFEQDILKSVTSEDLAMVLSKKNVKFVLLEASYSQPKLRHLIEAVTTQVAQVGSISVRLVPDGVRFKEELIKMPRFGVGSNWKMEPGAILNEKNEMIVTATSAATQILPVMQNKRYLNSVVARCLDQPGQGRVQVNWVDKNSKYITTSALIFDCSTQPTRHTLETFAPEDSAYAVVYTSAHTDVPIVFIENSFKQ